MSDDRNFPKGSDFADRIESALKLSGMSPTKFGYTYFGDPGAIKRLRTDARLYTPTLKKINGVLALYSV